MLIGVLCEVVASVFAEEKEACAIRVVKENLLLLLLTLDEDNSGNISRSEINEVLEFPAALEVFAQLSVNVSTLIEHLDMYFEESMEKMGSTEVSISDIIDLAFLPLHDLLFVFQGHYEGSTERAHRHAQGTGLVGATSSISHSKLCIMCVGFWQTRHANREDRQGKTLENRHCS